MNCPICSKPSALTKDNPWRPFCSERCKLIDFGHWADEDYRVASEENQPSVDDDEESRQARARTAAGETD